MKRGTLKALMELDKSIQANTPRIEEKLSRSGAKPEPAVVYSIAKYYRTLKRLTNEH